MERTSSDNIRTSGPGYNNTRGVDTCGAPHGERDIQAILMIYHKYLPQSSDGKKALVASNLLYLISPCIFRTRECS
jgi:hypothetical protein